MCQKARPIKQDSARPELTQHFTMIGSENDQCSLGDLLLHEHIQNLSDPVIHLFL